MCIVQASKNYVWVALIFFALCAGYLGEKYLFDSCIVGICTFFAVIIFATRIKYADERES